MAQTMYWAYLGFHMLALALDIFLIMMSFKARPSRGQNAIVFVETSGLIYILGFLIEIMATTEEGYYLACVTQYMGEYLAFIAILRFVSCLSRRAVGILVYLVHFVLSGLLWITLACTRESGFFYKEIIANNDGWFPRPEFVYGPGFYISIAYIVLVSIEIIILVVAAIKDGTALDKKRNRLVLWGLAMNWIPYILKVAGLTYGYEIPAFGLILTFVFLYLALFRYGVIDSMQIASDYALDRTEEGIMVVDSRYQYLYSNRKMRDLFGKFSIGFDIRKDQTLSKIVHGETTQMKIGKHVYEIKLEQLVEHGFAQGVMIWAIDNTEIHNQISQMNESVNHDGLTGLYNRYRFKELVEEQIANKIPGAFVILDMDNFKKVNDMYGHQRGDAVLIKLADLLNGFGDELFACRLGGDEFCVFFKNVKDKAVIEEKMQIIMDEFSKAFRENDEVHCGLSAGIVMYWGNGVTNFETLYSKGDRALYVSKNAGKNQFTFADFVRKENSK